MSPLRRSSNSNQPNDLPPQPGQFVNPPQGQGAYGSQNQQPYGQGQAWGQQGPAQGAPMNGAPQWGAMPPTMPQQPKKSWPARHKVLTGLLGLVVLGGVASAFGGGDDSSASASDPTTTAAAAAGKATTAAAKASNTATAAAQTMPGMNEVIHYNTYDFTITSLKCGVKTLGGQYTSQKAQGQFCLVGINVKNTGTKAQTFMADNQKLLDTAGREYSYSSEATVAEMMEKGDSDVWLKEINPGNTVKGMLIYDVPTDTKPAKIHLSDGGFTDEGIDVRLSK